MTLIFEGRCLGISFMTQLSNTPFGAKIKQLEKALDESEKWKHDEVEKFRNRLRDSAPYEKRLADD